MKTVLLFIFSMFALWSHAEDITRFLMIHNNPAILYYDQYSNRVITTLQQNINCDLFYRLEWLDTSEFRHKVKVYYDNTNISIAEGWINKTDCGVELLGERVDDDKMIIELYDQTSFGQAPTNIIISAYQQAIVLEAHDIFYKVLIYDWDSNEARIGWVYKFCTNNKACN